MGKKGEKKSKAGEVKQSDLDLSTGLNFWLNKIADEAGLDIPDICSIVYISFAFSPPRHSQGPAFFRGPHSTWVSFWSCLGILDPASFCVDVKTQEAAFYCLVLNMANSTAAVTITTRRHSTAFYSMPPVHTYIIPTGETPARPLEIHDGDKKGKITIVVSIVIIGEWRAVAWGQKRDDLLSEIHLILDSKSMLAIGPQWKKQLSMSFSRVRACVLPKPRRDNLAKRGPLMKSPHKKKRKKRGRGSNLIIDTSQWQALFSNKSSATCHKMDEAAAASTFDFGWLISE